MSGGWKEETDRDWRAGFVYRYPKPNTLGDQRWACLEVMHPGREGVVTMYKLKTRFWGSAWRLQFRGMNPIRPGGTWWVRPMTPHERVTAVKLLLAAKGDDDA